MTIAGSNPKISSSTTRPGRPSPPDLAAVKRHFPLGSEQKKNVRPLFSSTLMSLPSLISRPHQGQLVNCAGVPDPETLHLSSLSFRIASAESFVVPGVTLLPPQRP